MAAASAGFIPLSTLLNDCNAAAGADASPACRFLASAAERLTLRPDTPGTATVTSDAGVATGVATVVVVVVVVEPLSLLLPPPLLPPPPDDVVP